MPRKMGSEKGYNENNRIKLILIIKYLNICGIDLSLKTYTLPKN